MTGAWRIACGTHLIVRKKIADARNDIVTHRLSFPK